MKPASPVLSYQADYLRDVVFGKDQPEYIPMPAVVDTDGMVTARWVLTWRERLRVLFNGDVWLQLLTFNVLLPPPVKLSVYEP